MVIQPLQAEMHKPWKPNGVFQFESTYLSQLALSASFEYVLYVFK